eukprot:TRINITY_DN3091_c0_g1_i4.p2 TRINITY_DN3091_c0_g1~~TRINITY_DN3091_c0_g1_i4.p2  ORF type:complete len:223 (+),score=95.70 TRINITY_DN3091_c0_g1_i4:76-669(+)
MNMVVQLVSLGVMYSVTRAIDFTEETNVFFLRILYLAVQGLCWACMLFIWMVIVNKNNTAKVQVFDQGFWGNDPFDDKKEPVQVTVRDYHLMHLKQMMLRLLMSTGVIALLHLKWALMPPLLMQCMLNPHQIYSSNVFAIHILGKTEANYPLPWDQQQPMDFSKFLDASGGDSKSKKAKQDRELERLRKVNRKATRA